MASTLFAVGSEGHGRSPRFATALRDLGAEDAVQGEMAGTREQNDKLKGDQKPGRSPKALAFAAFL